MQIEQINPRAIGFVQSFIPAGNELGIDVTQLEDKNFVIDFGIASRGGLEAGLNLARICTAGLAAVDLVSSSETSQQIGLDVPLVSVRTDLPLISCMGNQYGGWPVKSNDFFAIGSGPMRMIRGKEDLLEQYGLICEGADAIGVLECGKFPDDAAIQQMRSELPQPLNTLTLCVAPTRSTAGGIQIVARSVEATMHKLHELQFDLRKVRSAFGTAPLPPPSADDLTGIGRTNDAILYGGRVALWVDCNNDEIQEIGPKIPSSYSPEFGRPFGEIFSDSGGDFYSLDPMLFSAAQISLISCITGQSFRFGDTRNDIVKTSFC